MPPPGEAPGVWYRRRDYVGFYRRLLIVGVDSLVVFMVCVPCGSLAALEILPGVLTLMWFMLAWGYLGVLGAHSATLGYLIANARIVTLYGERPSVWRMSFRLALWCFGPFNPHIDLAWVLGDPQWRSLRDKMAGTYVISREARPAGLGPTRLYYLLFLGFHLPYLEVSAPQPR
ncbi:MAG: RDD family protein [Planctomycetia bacterium]|nr:RDD family protein [Planctomycetia bacterium]